MVLIELSSVKLLKSSVVLVVFSNPPKSLLNLFPQEFIVLFVIELGFKESIFSVRGVLLMVYAPLLVFLNCTYQYRRTKLTIIVPLSASSHASLLSTFQAIFKTPHLLKFN